MARALGIIAHIFANDLSYSHYSTESLKPPCKGGAINPIFQIGKLRLREFCLLIPLFFLSHLGVPVCWVLVAPG